MKTLKYLVVLGLCIVVMTACGNEEKPTPVKEVTTDIVENQIKPSPVPEAENEEFDDSLLLDPVFSILQETMTNMISTQNISFETTVIENNYYIDQSDAVMENYVDISATFRGNMDAESESAYIYHSGSYSHSEADFGSPELNLIDWSEADSDVYLSKDFGYYTYYDETDEWYSEHLDENFKTMDHITDLITFFMLHDDKIVLEEITDLNDSDYGSKTLNLMLTPAEFVENLLPLTYTFFNGSYKDIMYEHMLYMAEEELKYHYIGLIIKEDGTLGYYVSYGAYPRDGGEDDTYSYFMRTDFYDYNATTVAPLPAEAIGHATEVEISY